MEIAKQYVFTYIATGGLYAPILFISFHLLRPLLFLPVVLMCVAGGVLFGAVAGTLYSVIGITLSSVLFYGLVHWMPKTFKKITSVKDKLIGKNTNVSTPQITLLRLIPFIHFHISSLILIDMSADFKEYTKSSMLSSIPLAAIYTSIGKYISSLSPMYICLFLALLLLTIFLIRKRKNYIKWHDFFQMSA